MKWWRSISGPAVIVVLAAQISSPAYAENALPPEKVEFFEAKIRPVLVEHCYRCHSSKAEKLKGGLFLDSREGWQTTGDSGPSIIAGKPDESMLLTAIRYDDADLEMPPKEKMSDEVIADFERWIAMGAPDPRDVPTGGIKVRNVLYETKDAENHWAFQPIARPDVPEIDDPWIRTPVDAFILEKLHDAGLSKSAPAEPRSLIRRVSYDLTGLPPSIEQVQNFSNHADFAYVVDELLASPQYGIKYARHWLDLARYADTNGIRNAPTAPNPYHPFAWTYRDWVIEALNDDLPYNEFIEQQIAGDHFATDGDPNPHAALGFLRIGKTFGQNENDRIDDRIDALSKTFLGLTVACARCHDHKFDPVYQSDYYALHGIFSSSEDVDVYLIPPSRLEGHAEFVAETEKMLSDARSEARDNINAYISDLVHRSYDYLLAAQHFRDGKTKEKIAERAAREVDLKPIPFEAWVKALEFWEQRDDRVFAPWFAFPKLGPGPFIQALQDGSIATNPIVADAIVIRTPATREELAEVYHQLAVDTEAAMQKRYPLTEVIVTLVNVQRNWRGDEYDPFAESPRALDDPDREELRRVLLGFEGPWGGPRMPPQMLMRSGAGDYKNVIKHAMHNIEKMKGEHGGAPVKAMSMRDLEKPVDSPLFVRGNADQPGKIIPRDYLAHFRADAEGTSAVFSKGSGRLELAKKITDPDNPLTARVIVNRVWQWHFGSGLVNTPSDFGLNGSAPSHPELLDWLASWFVDDADWSPKKLHRLIMNSSVYQQSALPRADPEIAEIDPGNRLLWRFPPRRLQYEELRDTIALHAGKLEPARIGGRPAKSDDDRRRTLFRYIDRMDLPYESQIFDFPNADLTAAERESSIVPQQGLYFLNSPWMIDRASDIATHCTSIADPEQRLSKLFRILFQRLPTSTETNMSRAYLAENGDDWNQLVHALLTTNELVFLH